MKWSINWLKQYLNTKLSPEEIADKLNAIGLEVEGLENPILPVAAKIIECIPHPDSDHLHILKVKFVKEFYCWLEIIYQKIILVLGIKQ